MTVAIIEGVTIWDAGIRTVKIVSDQISSKRD